MTKNMLILFCCLIAGHCTRAQSSADTERTLLRKIYTSAPDLFAAVRGAEEEYIAHWYLTSDTLAGTTHSSVYIYDSSHAFYATYLIRDTDKATALNLLEAWKKKVAAYFPELKVTAGSTGNKWIFSPVGGTYPQPGILLSANVQPGIDTNWCTQLLINYGIE